MKFLDNALSLKKVGEEVKKRGIDKKRGKLTETNNGGRVQIYRNIPH